MRKQLLLLVSLLFLSGVATLVGCSPAPANCPDSCKGQTSTCSPDSDGIRQCAQNVQTGCFVWSVLPCKSGERCVIAENKAQCVASDTCQNSKHRRGCFESKAYWYDDCGNRTSFIENCPNGCDQGQCKTSNDCPQDCQTGQTRCDSSQIQRCKETRPGCFVWEASQYCPNGQICAGTSCQPRTQCSQECKKGELRCKNNGLALCMEWKPGCLAWAPGKLCGPTEFCSNGSCQPKGQCPPNPPCSTGQKRCSGNSIQECSNNANGCPEWKTITTCAAGQTCQAGQCKTGCANACTAGQKRCSGNTIQSCVRSSSGCTLWQNSQTCPSGQSCQAGQCKAGCTDACTAGQKRCSGTGVQTCSKASNGCTVWGVASPCASGQTCSGGVCKSSCPAGSCTPGAARCSGSTPQKCVAGSNGCGVWQRLTACSGGKICNNGQCITQGDPATRTQQQVCTRWKTDYPEKSKPNFQSKGGCDPGTISEGSIQDGLRRTNLFRWLVGLPPVPENKSLRQKLQACAVLEANNTPFTGGVKNPHSPTSSAKCYSRDGASMAGSSNLSWGVGSPAQSVDQFVVDRGVASLGHRRWVLAPRLGSTAFGFATGTGRYRTATCQHVFGSGGQARPDYVAYPPQGFVPLSAIKLGRYTVTDWSFSSSKYRVNGSTKVTVTRLNDGKVLTPKVRYLSGNYGGMTGIAFAPGTPKAGENYKVQIGTLVSYTVKFVSCP